MNKTKQTNNQKKNKNKSASPIHYLDCDVETVPKDRRKRRTNKKK